MKIKALGGCCKRSTQNYENIVQAAKELGIEDVVEHVSDTEEILSLGVMSTPGLVIDGKVYSAGSPLTVEQAKAMIESAQTNSCSCCKDEGSCEGQSCCGEAGCADDNCDTGGCHKK